MPPGRRGTGIICPARLARSTPECEYAPAGGHSRTGRGALTGAWKTYEWASVAGAREDQGVLRGSRSRRLSTVMVHSPAAGTGERGLKGPADLAATAADRISRIAAHGLHGRLDLRLFASGNSGCNENATSDLPAPGLLFGQRTGC